MKDADRPLLGILLMLLFCMLAPITDAAAKLLSTVVPLGMMLIVRFLLQSLILAPIVMASTRTWYMTPRIYTIAAARAVLHILGMMGMITALRYLPLADAVAITFVMPFIMLLLGKYVLGEEVGARRLIACIVGFIGTLLVIEPSFDAVGWFALLPLGVAVVFSVFVLLTRQIAKETDPITLQAVNGIMALALLVPMMALARVYWPDWGMWRWHMPDTRSLWLLGLIGVMGTVAHLVMTWSLRFAPAATLAPMHYLEIPFTTAVGWIVFSDLPGPKASLGIAITMAAGLYMIMRERAKARQS